MTIMTLALRLLGSKMVQVERKITAQVNQKKNVGAVVCRSICICIMTFLLKL